MRNEPTEVQNHLPSRKLHILRTRFGFLSDDSNTLSYTLEELGRKLKVTRERVRQIEKQALSRLANSSHADSLRLYLDA